MRFFIFLLWLTASTHIYAATVLIEIQHKENVEIEIYDAALGQYIQYKSTFDFPDKTTFGLDDGRFTLLEMIIDGQPYLLYVKGSYITIDLIKSKVKSDAYFLFKRKKDFFNTDVNGKWLLHLFEIEKFYKGLLDKMDSLIKVDNSYGMSENGVHFWDEASAKKMLSYLKASHTNEQNFKLKYNCPSFIKYAETCYALAYQYSGYDIDRTADLTGQYDLIVNDMPEGTAEAVILHHFFRPATPLSTMQSAANFDVFNTLNSRVKYAAKRAIDLKKSKITIDPVSKINWFEASSIDESLNTFFDQRIYNKPTLIVFWTTFGGLMNREYTYLRELNDIYGDYFDFVYVCVNAYGQERKAKAIIAREGLNGNHLFPQTADAYWKSEWKGEKISALPFYIITNVDHEVLVAVNTPLDFNDRVLAQIKALKNGKGSEAN